MAEYRIYWDVYWGQTMAWEDFVNFIDADTPARILMAKLKMNRRSFYMWRGRALDELKVRSS